MKAPVNKSWWWLVHTLLVSLVWLTIEEKLRSKANTLYLRSPRYLYGASVMVQGQ
jgi:hypothetical protein